MKQTQTENSHFEAKVKLRQKFLPDTDSLKVLDCFSADGKLWNEIKKHNPERKINVLRIESRRDAKGVYLAGDNRKILPVINLERYDIIDLDAFGNPFEQLEIIFPRRIKPCRYFCTVIFQTIGKKVQKGLLEQLGYTPKMIKKCWTLCSNNPFEKFCNYLSLHKVKEVYAIRFNGGFKNYISFFR